jgi:hypothetical protein
MFPDWVYEVLGWAVGGCVLAVIAALTVYFGHRARAAGRKAEPAASELLAKFGEMHARGVLSDAEFRTIKTSLSTRLQEELKDNGETACDD